MMDHGYTVGLGNDLYMDMGDNNDDGGKQEQIRKDVFLTPAVPKNKKKKVLVSDVKKKKKKPEDEDGDGDVEPSLKKVKKMCMNDVPLKPVGLSLSGSGMQLYVKADGPMMQRLSEDYEMVNVKPCYEFTKRNTTTQTSQCRDAANDTFDPLRDEMADKWSENISNNKRPEPGTADRSFHHRQDPGLPEKRQVDLQYLFAEDKGYPKVRDLTQDQRTFAKASYQGQGHRNLTRRPDQGHENKSYAADYDCCQDEMTYVKTPCQGQGHRNITRRPDQGHENKSYAADYDCCQDEMTCVKTAHQGQGHRNITRRPDQGHENKCCADGYDSCQDEMTYVKTPCQGHRNITRRPDQGHETKCCAEGYDSCQDEMTCVKTAHQGQGHRNITRRPDQGHVNKCCAEGYDSCQDEMTCVKTAHQGQGHRNITRRPDQGHENKCCAEGYDSCQDEMTCVKTAHQGQGHRTNVRRPEQTSVEKCYLEGSDSHHDDRSYSNRCDRHISRQKATPRSQGSGSVPAKINRGEWAERPRTSPDDSDRFDVGIQQIPVYSHVNPTHKRPTNPSQTTPRDVPRSTNRVVDDRARGTSHVITDDDYRDLYEVNIPASPTNAHAHTCKERNTSYKTWASTSHAADQRDARSEPTPTTAEDSTLSTLSEFDLSRLPTEALDAVTLKKFAEYSKLMRRSLRQEYKQMNQLIKDFTEEMMERNKALLDENQSNNTANNTDNNTEEEMKKDSSCRIM
ncbi:uncharacterized protein LOC131936451 [Physella acuta]|uniref:uncharacterized protein LOC131936451 n=1 Tax=Physella acuta TaxID=109671 RepID=UPI0027DB80C7|nr:uncharacterized protein LOC131936451 [Physella acuta]